MAGKDQSDPQIPCFQTGMKPRLASQQNLTTGPMCVSQEFGRRTAGNSDLRNRSVWIADELYRGLPELLADDGYQFLGRDR